MLEQAGFEAPPVSDRQPGDSAAASDRQEPDPPIASARPRAAIYARVSTGEQNIVQQKDLLRRCCAERGYDLVLTASDKAVSGSERDRVGWNRVLYHGRRGDYRVLVVQDLDRICRNWAMGVEVEQFILETGIRLESLGEPVDFSSATGRLMFRVKMCVAAHQRESTIERIKVGVERAKLEGKYLGRRKGAVNRPKRGRPRKKK